MGKFQHLLIYLLIILFAIFILPMTSSVAIDKKKNNSADLQSDNISKQQKDPEQTNVPGNSLTGSADDAILSSENVEEEIDPAQDEAETKFVLPLSKGKLTAKFGNMKNPYTQKIVHHNGIDVACPKGSDVFAAADGKIVTLNKVVEFLRLIY